MTGLSESTLSPAFREASRSLTKSQQTEMAYASAIAPSSKGGSYYFKTGQTAGFSAIILWRTDPKIGFIVMSNRGKFNAVNELGKMLIEDSLR